MTLCCGTPPEGRQRWTMQLLADELCRLKVVTHVCPETVRQTLKKNRLKPWLTRRFCIPEADRARFVSQMEEVLDVYHEPRDAAHPLICMDEASKQIVADTVTGLPMTPGQSRREDPHYERKDVRAMFAFFDPVRGWRRMSVRRTRTRQDWAEVRRLLDEDYPEAKRVTLVCDNLNTHNIASLYATFPAAEAHRLDRKLRLIHTPRSGSWLNTAEMELSVLTRQCIGCRFESAEAMAKQMAKWEANRNESGSGAHWQFTTADARITLWKLYPVECDIER